MKTITIKQPWASHIAAGRKTIETRVHGNFKGLVGERIAIHAGKGIDKYGPALPDDDFPRGAVICTAVVESMEQVVWDDISSGRARMMSRQALAPVWEGLYLYYLTDIEMLDEPIPARGQLGVWHVDCIVGDQ